MEGLALYHFGAQERGVTFMLFSFFITSPAPSYLKRGVLGIRLIYSYALGLLLPKVKFGRRGARLGPCTIFIHNTDLIKRIAPPTALNCYSYSPCPSLKISHCTFLSLLSLPDITGYCDILYVQGVEILFKQIEIIVHNPCLLLIIHQYPY